MVASFSIDIYIPFIKLIFQSEDPKKQIPFFIYEKNSKNTKIILSSFKNILNLSNSRFTNREILELFDIPEIAKKFNISDEEIKVLYNWIEEANIRCFIDCDHQNCLSLPENKKNTWFYGIEKLLFSYSVNDTKSIWNKILSCSLINGSRAELIGKLAIFINTLKKWQKKLSKLQYLKYWRSLSEDLINDFFYKNTKIEKSIQMIQKNWIKIIDNGLLSNYKEKVSIELLKKIFFCKNNYVNHRKFLPGAINFCHPSSICYIPFKIICIIGMNNTNISYVNNLDNYDLLKKYPLFTDRNIYQENAYLFIHLIACARKYFYISYVGYSEKDNRKIYPLDLVNQLLNYIVSNFYLKKDQSKNIKENTDKIIQKLCTTYKKEHFYDKYNISTSTLNDTKNNLKKTYSAFLKIRKSSKINFCNQIDLKNLIQFWKNPIRYFCNVVLNIKNNSKEQEMVITEPFSLSKLDSFKIKKDLLKKTINKQDTKETLQYYILSGKLPYNFFGEILWNRKMKDIESISKLVIKNRNIKKTKEISLKIKKYQINGTLFEIQKMGLLRWKPTLINYSDRISLWIEHLIYCSMNGVGESTIIGYKNNMWSFCSLNPDIAYKYLEKYVAGYIKGMKKPLLLTKSGASWLDKTYDMEKKCVIKDKKIKIKGYKKLLETWSGNDYIEGEKEDFYLKAIMLELNKKNINKICKIAEKWLLPILQNKKTT